MTKTSTISREAEAFRVLAEQILSPEFEEMLSGRGIGYASPRIHVARLLDIADEAMEIASQTTDESMRSETKRLLADTFDLLQQLKKVETGDPLMARSTWSDLQLLLEQHASGVYSPETMYNPIQSRYRSLAAFHAVQHMGLARLSEFGREMATVRDDAVSHARQIEHQLALVRAAPGQWTAHAFAGEFQKGAERYNTQSLIFLGAAILLMVAGGAFAWVSVPNVADNVDPRIWVPSLLTRVIVISFVSTVSVVAFRSYRANRHLAITNEHRAAVLKTFDLLVKSTEDLETRSVLLKAAANCIFQAGSTGFLGDGDAKSDDQLIGLLRETLVKRGSDAAKA